MDDRSFAAAMALRRSRARTRRGFPNIPDGVLACEPCSGAGVAGGTRCGSCEGWGFVDEEKKPVPLWTVQGGFYIFGEGDLVLQNIVTMHKAARRAWPKSEFYGSQKPINWIADWQHASQRYSARENVRGVELWPLPTPAPKDMRCEINARTGDAPLELISQLDGVAKTVRIKYPALEHLQIMKQDAARPERLLAAIDLLWSNDIQPYHLEITTPRVASGAPPEILSARFSRKDELAPLLVRSAEFPTAPIMIRGQSGGLLIELYTR